MKLSRAAASVCGFLIWALTPSVQAGESKSAWQAEWDGAVEAAKNDARITIYHTRGPFENVFGEFSKRYPAIKVVSVSGRGGELISRIMAERRAGRQGADVYLGATGTPMDVLYPAKVLEPIQSMMILPEVKEPSNWFRKQHHYADPENKYIFVFEGVVRSDMAYNTKLVDSKEVGSYWDLVKPKWKGKIAAMDPKLSGFPSGLLQFAYYSPELGVKFLRQLFGEMDITLSRDGRQLVDWLAVGKFCHCPGAVRQRCPGGHEAGAPVGAVRAAGLQGRTLHARHAGIAQRPKPAAASQRDQGVRQLASFEGWPDSLSKGVFANRSHLYFARRRSHRSGLRVIPTQAGRQVYARLSSGVQRPRSGVQGDRGGGEEVAVLNFGMLPSWQSR